MKDLMLQKIADKTKNDDIVWGFREYLYRENKKYDKSFYVAHPFSNDLKNEFFNSRIVFYPRRGTIWFISTAAWSINPNGCILVNFHEVFPSFWERRRSLKNFTKEIKENMRRRKAREQADEIERRQELCSKVSELF